MAHVAVEPRWLEAHPPADLHPEDARWVTWLREAFADRPERFAHSVAVWRRAIEATRTSLAHLGEQRRDTFVLAALLHDVGRAIDPANREPHGFVGARFVDSLGLHPVARLVAHHSGARFEATLRSMSHLDRWETTDPTLAQALTSIDRTTDSVGGRVTLPDRRADLARRYGPDSLQVTVFDLTLAEAEIGAALLGDAPSQPSV